MGFCRLIPLVNFETPSVFDSCETHYDFLQALVWQYRLSRDVRTKNSMLAVIMAYRDHYPRHFKKLDLADISFLNNEIEIHYLRLIKLRRIALAELVKVA